MRNNTLALRMVVSLLFVTILFSCAPEPEKREVVLYENYCASCHLAPEIGNLPKDIWEDYVLPDMASRMKIKELYEDPDQAKAGFRPEIKLNDWIALQNYVISLAPEQLPETPLPKQELLSGFRPKTLELDDQNGAFFTFLEFEEKRNTMVLGDISGNVKRYDFKSESVEQLFQGETPVTWYNKNRDTEFISEVGILDPSELERGKIILKQGKDTLALNHAFHRPVHNLVEDLNGDGTLEMVVSEFGNETGRLSLLVQKDTGVYDKKVLLNLPGCIRTIAKDMDRDGKLDLVTITSQAWESITILYQKENLVFEADKVLEFSSVYGSSWFELVDYNNDGFDDIVTVNGDNADKSYVHKPYHGMRIHLNDGQNNFSEVFFYPLNGATRLIADDFDADGDIDFGLISTFPNYDRAPQLTFVYLENEESDAYRFRSKILEHPNQGRWFLMDKGDVDADGDMDILLSSFTYVFTPVPENLSKQWAETNVDVLILENLLN